MNLTFTINGKTYSPSAAEQDMPLLWYLRENLNLKGTKYGCGIGQCGACTVHLNGQAARACLLPLNSLNGANITSIEGLAANAENLHPVQKAWMEIDVPQCGYCQCGQIMAAAALLKNKPKPSDADIEANMTNICRCMSYVRIRAAVKQAAEFYEA